MSLKDTVKNLRTLLQDVISDLDKAENGNKAASQRVRTGTIRLEKIAKLFRKESIKAEKSGNFKKKKSSPSKGGSSSSKSSSSKASSSSSSTSKGGSAKKGGSASRGKTKAKAKPKALAKKRATAKILKKSK